MKFKEKLSYRGLSKHSGELLFKTPECLCKKYISLTLDF